MSRRSLQDFYDRTSCYANNGILGTLSTIDMLERDHIFQTIYREIKTQIDNTSQHTTEHNSELQQIQLIDISKLCGVNCGDILHWQPDANRWQRELVPYPEYLKLQAQYISEINALSSSKTTVDPSASSAASESPQLCAENRGELPVLGAKDEAEAEVLLWRDLLLRAAYNGHWSPSGTNWQPMRAVELTSGELRHLAREAGYSGDGVRAGLAIIGQRRYRSLLDDIAQVCMYQQRSKADAFDIGIYQLSCELTCYARGVVPLLQPIPVERQHKVSMALVDIMRRRMGALQRMDIPQIAEELEKSKWLLDYLEHDRAFVDSLLCGTWSEDVPLQLDFADKSEFDRLVEARCTQRVASSQLEIPVEFFDQIWSDCLPLLGAYAHAVRYAVFSWHHAVPRETGRAMFEGLYGKGADPQSGRGGVGGILSRANLANLLAWIEHTLGELPHPLRPLRDVPAEVSEIQARDIAMPLAAVPQYLQQYLASGPRFSERDDILVNRRGQPLSLTDFLRIIRQMLFSFGTFFLRFQNTHPVTAIILSREDLPEQHEIYKAIGRLSQALSLSCRAWGLTSIIKEGPIEFAAEKIQALVAQYHPDPVFAEAVRRGQFYPRLTFQVGHPLQPDDMVASVAAEHSGLEERLRDRRPTRYPIQQQYYPYIA